MELLWLVIGAGLAWFVFSFRATKGRVRSAAQHECREFVAAIEATRGNTENFAAHLNALQHFEVYEQRRSDLLQGGPSGVTLPAHRALLASFWLEALVAGRFIDRHGQPLNGTARVANFWEGVNYIRRERERLMFSQASAMPPP